MKLVIDAAGGIAGDMFTAALISAGANFELLRAAMSKAAAKLGSARVDIRQTSDGSTQLNIQLQSNRNHLHGSEAKGILNELFQKFAVTEKYRAFGLTATDILLKAEIKAHRDFNIVIKENTGHSHRHPHRHSHGQNHGHTHNSEEESFLHEAQDIVIDIIGAVLGMQDLGIEPEAKLLTPVSVGGGSVECSHGILPVPAPAAQVILERYDIEWQAGPLDVELATPTGISILAALRVKKHNPSTLTGEKVIATGLARGTKILDIPPLKIFLVQ